MKLIDLWNEYEKDPNDKEAEEALCQRIQMFAKKVLGRFRVNNPTVSYEDLLQQAYICFLEIIPKYVEDRGTLEGFFLLSYRKHIINFLRKLPRSVPFRDTEGDYSNPLDILIAREFDNEVRCLLTETETYVYDSYLKEGIFSYKEIAEEEKTEEDTVRWIVDSIGNKIRQFLDREYNFYKERN